VILILVKEIAGLILHALGEEWIVVVLARPNVFLMIAVNGIFWLWGWEVRLV